MQIGPLRIKSSTYGLSIHFPYKRKSKAHLDHPKEFKELQSGEKLNIGGGKGHPKVEGWKIVDIRSHADVVLNLSKDKLPFADNSTNVIFSSHTLEHIIPQDLDFVLSEFYRVMNKKGSLLRIAVPDIAIATKAYVEKDIAFFENSKEAAYEKNLPMGGLFASWLYSTRLTKGGDMSDMMGHVHCFDADYMLYRLNKAGFKKAWKSEYRKSIFPELRSDAFDRLPMESLFVEAVLD